MPSDSLNEALNFAIRELQHIQSDAEYCYGKPFDHTEKLGKMAKDALEKISIIRQPMPVMSPVSLAKCKWEISKVFVPDGIWNIEEGMKMERAAKAVLDAAEVYYVD